MRTRRSLLNFATMVVYTAVVMAVGLVASPWLEFWLGPGAFGGYRVVNDLYGYLGLLEMGLSGALSPLLARAIGRGDDEVLGRLTAAGVRAYLRVSLLMAAAGLALTLAVPWFAAGLPRNGLGDLRRGWLVLLLARLPLALLPFRTVVEARQQGYRINLLLVAQSVLITALALVLARAGWGITGQSLASAVGTWLFGLVVAGSVLRGEPGLVRRLRRPSWGDAETRRALRRLSVPALVIGLCGRLGLLTDNLVVGGLLGVGSVTTLYFTQRLAVVAQSLLQGVGGATWAALAELHARGEHETFNRRLVELDDPGGRPGGRRSAGRRVQPPLLRPLGRPVGAVRRRRLDRGGRAERPDPGADVALGLVPQRHRAPAPAGGADGRLGDFEHYCKPGLDALSGVIGPLLGSTVSFLAVSVWAAAVALAADVRHPTGRAGAGRASARWRGACRTRPRCGGSQADTAPEAGPAWRSRRARRVSGSSPSPRSRSTAAPTATAGAPASATSAAGPSHEAVGVAMETEPGNRDPEKSGIGRVASGLRYSEETR